MFPSMFVLHKLLHSISFCIIFYGILSYISISLWHFVFNVFHSVLPVLVCLFLFLLAVVVVVAVVAAVVVVVAVVTRYAWQPCSLRYG